MDPVATPVKTLRMCLVNTKRRLDAKLDGVHRKSVGIALGSGAARGLSHIGVLDVLLKSGIPIDVIVGCSMGAVVGGCYAAGMEPHEIEEIALKIDKREVAKFTDVTAPRRGGLIAGARIEELLQDLTKDLHFDQLRLPFACAATDILTGEEFPIDDGSVCRGIRASSSIPGVLAPVVMGQRVLVDGGVLNPIPTNYLVAMDVDVSIAVDVMPRLSPSPDQLGKVPSILTSIINAFDVMGRLVAAPLSRLATVVISPDVGTVPGQEFWRAEEIITEGRKAALQALPAIEEAISGTLSTVEIS